MMKKKGVEMTMQTIVITLLLLLVLLVLIAIFGGFMNKGGEDINKVNDGYDCMCGDNNKGKIRYECKDNEREVIGNFGSLREGKACCCPIPE
ncbi:MAG: hypothetical protein ACOC1K_06920 [Nanoarchaeota archaeon]